MTAGSVLDSVTALMSAEGRADPYPLYRRLHEFGPVLSFDGGYTVVLGYDEASQVLRDPQFRVEDAAWHDQVWPQWREHPSLVAFLESMLFANSPRHERLRRLVSRSFTARRVADMRPAISALTGQLCDRLAASGGDGSPVDAMAEFAYLLPVTVIGELLGVAETDRDWFRPRVAELAIVLEMNTEGLELAAADRAVVELNEYFGDLAEQRRADPQDDLVSSLVAHHDRGDGQLDDAELLGNLVLLLAAGFETTTNLLGNGIAVLLDEPDVRADLSARPELTTAFVEEVLRYDSPVQLTSRVAASERSVGDVTVAPGASTLVLSGAANHDPRRFADPARFNLHRADNQPISFGAGAHYCLGAALARLEGQVAFATLLERFPDFRAGGERTRRDRLTLRGFESLPLLLA